MAVLPTVYDATQAPPGKHTALVWQFVPYKLQDGGALKWDEVKEEYGEYCLKTWREYAPNLTSDNILAQFDYSPLDIEREQKAMIGGGFMHGDPSPDQMGYFRPFVGWSHYRMPIKGLYLCGASTHSSGGITGSPGYNAAGTIAEDLGLKKWWE